MVIERVLLQFEKGGKELLGEYRLQGITLEELQALFGESSEDPMYDSYDVTESQVERLEKATGVSIDLHSYDYFIQAYSTEDTSSPIAS